MPRKKAISFHEPDVRGPPIDDAWIFHTAALRFSPAWRGRSVPLMRLLELLEEQWLRGKRLENGRLMAMYVNMVGRAISRGRIPEVIAEGVARGLIEVQQADPWPRPQGTKQAPNLFRLTYLAFSTVDKKGVVTWHKATNEWRHFAEPPARPKQSFKRIRESRLNDPAFKPKRGIPSTESGTRPGFENEENSQKQGTESGTGSRYRIRYSLYYIIGGYRRLVPASSPCC